MLETPFNVSYSHKDLSLFREKRLWGSSQGVLFSDDSDNDCSLKFHLITVSVGCLHCLILPNRVNLHHHLNLKSNWTINLAFVGSNVTSDLKTYCGQKPQKNISRDRDIHLWLLDHLFESTLIILHVEGPWIGKQKPQNSVIDGGHWIAQESKPCLWK